METKQPLPNATAVLVLGICSIVFSCVFIGLVLGIIGLVLGSKGRKLNKQNPTAYTGFQNLNAGWICSIIGTCLGGLYVLYYIIVIAILGSAGIMSNMMYQ
jgi:hypothetical protein